MKREIKFREFSKERNEMFSEPYTDEYVNGGAPVNEFFKDSTSILMQYTGLKDKNGKEIYEGDVVEGNYWCESGEQFHRTIIEWEVTNPSAGYNDLTSGFIISLEDASTSEVIGNIYENPELTQNMRMFITKN